MDAKRDENRKTVGLAITDNASKTTEAIRVDPVTDRLLLAVEITTSTVPVDKAEDARDENRIPTCMATTDNASATPSNLLIDNRNGFLFVDMITK